MAGQQLSGAWIDEIAEWASREIEARQETLLELVGKELDKLGCGSHEHP